METVWVVWTEQGEYENYSCDPRGTFATKELADAHAAQLEASEKYDSVEVIPDTILEALPESVPYINWSAHITPDGSEDTGLGYHRGEQYRTWSNEIALTGRIGDWGRGVDLYVEVVGPDEDAVRAEYKRLLAEARSRLAKLTTA